MPISINKEISVANRNNVTLRGTVSSANAGVLQVEIFQNGQDQGAASVKPNGTWTFNAFIDNNSASEFVAELTDPQNNKENSSALDIVSGQPLKQQLESGITTGNDDSFIVYSAHGRALYDVVVTQTNNASQIPLADVVGRSGPGIAYTGHLGVPEMIENFRASGAQHDTLNLSDTSLHTLAQVLRHTTVNGGSATIHIDPLQSVTLEGVTKHQIASNPKDFVFTGGNSLS